MSDPADPVVPLSLSISAWSIVLNTLAGGRYDLMSQIIPELQKQLLAHVSADIAAAVAADAPAPDAPPSVLEDSLPLDGKVH
jgi:hypothetical protein